ncbi:MAG: HIT domain-containing protein [Rhizobiaceae bacterium]|nr:HIT domain-containing protein [Rhizobiaceae bacterium]
MTAYDDQNVFAKIMRGEMPCEKLYEDADTFVIMDIIPRSDGHCLVLPKLPARNVLDADPDSLAAVAKTTQRMARAVLKAFDADGVTIQQLNESAGGQVVFHLHVHIIPRFEGIRMGLPASQMADADVLKVNADKIRAALAA